MTQRKNTMKGLIVTALQAAIRRDNSWVVFENGTVVVIPAQKGIELCFDDEKMKKHAVEMLKNSTVHEDFGLAEYTGHPQGWFVSAGEDFVLRWVGRADVDDWGSKFEVIREAVQDIAADKKGLNVLHAHIQPVQPQQ